MSAQSLRDYLRSQREERVRRAGSKMVIPIPGYEERLAGRYRVLSFDDRMEIARRHGGADMDPTDTNVSADLIINACEELLEITGRDESGGLVTRGLDMRWIAEDVADLFDVPITQQSHSAIQALREVLDSEQIVDLLHEIRTQGDRIMSGVAKESEGESEPAAAGSPTSGRSLLPSTSA